MERTLWTSPFIFSPIYKEKVWGGRSLASVFGRQLPNGTNYGESWELVDREGEQVPIQNGPSAGKTLHDLWAHERCSVFGEAFENHPSSRFPLLVKILDARDDLSIQVHPPAGVAPSLNGEPKTEMWYIAHAERGSKLYVGLRNGVSRDDFESGITGGLTQDQVHAITPKAGDFIFIPSGRLHAIGAGLLIYEIQQNSDTTYRVFDWNRPGTDGQPRDLHVKESMKCIDFNDIEPVMDTPAGETLVECEHFHVLRRSVPHGQPTPS
ncbi:MAG: type I phosphomannose isomerase catalytic subunit, partial [Verrucomicrobiales bacterium]